MTVDSGINTARFQLFGQIIHAQREHARQSPKEIDMSLAALGLSRLGRHYQDQCRKQRDNATKGRHHKITVLSML